MSYSAERKNDRDQAPLPASPEELVAFKDFVTAKVMGSDKAVKYKDSMTETTKITARWMPSDTTDVHADIGEVHEPEYVDVLIHEHFGLVGGIDTTISKHFRYFPISGVSEYEEELREYYNGKRLIGEEIQRIMANLPEIDPETMAEEQKRAIEHARDFSRIYRGSNIPPLDQDTLAEAIWTLNQCGPSNAAPAPRYLVSG